MAGQISAIKKRLQTVNSTRKLTNATELVATVKLQKYPSVILKFSALIF